jgi:hypothetical protein
MLLEVHEAGQRVSTNKVAAHTLSMFPDATNQIAGHYDVECSVAPVCHEVGPPAHGERQWAPVVKKTWMAGTGPVMTIER